MTLKRLLPYGIVVIVFLVVYLITMIIPDQVLFLVLGYDWNKVINNNRLLLQRDIFTYGLSFIIIIINLLEVCVTVESRFLIRLLKSLLTITVIYLLCAGFYRLIGAPKIWNLYYYYRGIPARIFYLLSMMLTITGLIVLEIVQLIVFSQVQKSSVLRFIPVWFISKDSPGTPI